MIPSHPRRDAAPLPTSAFRPAAIAVATAVGLALSAGSAPAADVPVELRFAGEFGGAPFDCGTTYDGVGATDARIDVTDYRLFVSNVALLRADGPAVPVALEQDDLWQSGEVALLDFENAAGRCDNGTAETNALVRGTAPEGDYTGVAFDLGVPFEANHGDPTLQGSPLNLTAMFWNWQGGYRFLKLDTIPAAGPDPAAAGRHDAAAAMRDDATAAMDENEAKPDMAHGAGHGEMADAGPGADGEMTAAGHGAARDAGHGAGHGGAHGASAGAWMLHVGSAGCASASRTSAPASPDDCAAPNRPRVTLDGFDLERDVVVVDPVPALVGTDLGTNAPDTAPGCMSGVDDPDCTAVMPLLGIARDGVTPGQRLFSARPADR